MKSNTFVLGAGQSHELETAINRNGGNSEDVQWLVAGDNFNSVRRLARGEHISSVKSPHQILPLTDSEFKILKLGDCGDRFVNGRLMPLEKHTAVVDYDRSFNAQIAFMKCRLRDELRSVTFCSAVSGQRERSFEVLKFSREPVHKSFVLNEMACLGLYPADVTELLSFGARLKLIKQSLTIVALGSESSMTERVEKKGFLNFIWLIKEVEVEYPNQHPCLEHYAGSTPLLGHACSSNGGWKDHVLFLGVHR